MPEPHQSRVVENKDGGFVLLAVLLVSLILVAVASAVTMTVRSRIELTRAVAGSAEAEMLADAGVHLAMLDIDRARRAGGFERRFPIGGAARSCDARDGRGTLTIEVRDEAGKININSRNEPLLLAFLGGIGLDGDASRDLMSRLLDYRDGDTVTREGAAETGLDLASGEQGAPPFKNRPFDVIEELAQVPGFPIAASAAALPYVTVYSEIDGFDPALSPAGLTDIVAKGAEKAGLGSFASGDDLPGNFIARSTQRALTIAATASLPSGVRFTREAILVLSLSEDGGYVVRRWLQAPYVLARSGEDTLPPC